MLFDFNIKEIIAEFLSTEEPGQQRDFIEKKMAEAVRLNGLGRKSLGPISRIKKAYLIRHRNLDLVLNGLLKMAQDNAGAAGEY